ncbi:MAG: DUF4411 family protein [Bifidobacteriaceae bacterium]|jgi:hypothetical protein|nr:DUF4411 family protein [Bifidobacteriaceae bacterium]
MYILDANVFIQAHRAHYGLDFVPGFWDWLDRAHKLGMLASLDSVKKELDAGEDALATWEQSRGVMFLRMDPAAAPSLSWLASWAKSPSNGYTPAAVADFLRSADYQLVAYAHAHGHTVVTHEKAANPGAKKKIKIPDACASLQVPFLNPFTMLRDEQCRFVLEPRPGVA